MCKTTRMRFSTRRSIVPWQFDYFGMLRLAISDCVCLFQAAARPLSDVSAWNAVCDALMTACQFQSNTAPQFQFKSAPVGIRWNAHGPSLALAAAAKRARGHGRADFLIGFVLLGIFSAMPAFSQAVAFAVHLQNMDMMCQAIEKRAGEPFGTEGVGPFNERQVRGHQCSRTFIVSDKRSLNHVHTVH